MEYMDSRLSGNGRGGSVRGLVVDVVAAAACGEDFAGDGPGFVGGEVGGYIVHFLSVHHAADGVGRRGAFGEVASFHFVGVDAQLSATLGEHSRGAFGAGGSRVDAVDGDAEASKLN